MTIQEIKKEVAELMATTAHNWKAVYGKEGEATQEEREEYANFREYADKRIESLIPDSEKLSITLTGCAKGDLAHYDIEDSLQEVFKPGEGVQYDSESGQFWMYVNPRLVQPVLRHIEYHFPNQIKLTVEINKYNTNPWFQNWTQAERYLKEIESKV